MEFKTLREQEEIAKVRELIRTMGVNSYWEDNLDNAYIILDNGNIVGLLDANNDTFNGNSGYLEMIELFVKGYARKTLKTLFDNNPSLNEICGESIADAIEFWIHMGADFDGLDEEDIFDIIESGDVAAFTLSRDKFC